MKLHTAPVYAEDVAAHDPRRDAREGVGERREKRKTKEKQRKTWKTEVAAHGQKFAEVAAHGRKNEAAHGRNHDDEEQPNAAAHGSKI